MRDNGAVGQSAVDSAVAALQAAYTAITAAFVTLTEGATAVSIRDLYIIARYFGIGFGHPDWHKVAAADINDEGEITIEALAAVARMILDDWVSGVYQETNVRDHGSRDDPERRR